MIIAEVGQAHEGSLGIAHSYIDALKETGVDAIKFQTHIAEAESSAYEPFRTNFSYEDETRFDYWRRMEFTLEQWIGLKAHCEEVGLEFMSSPFSNAAVDLLESIGIIRYKIGSGEVNNLLLIERIIRTGKPIILSSGMSSLVELDETVNYIKKNNVEFSIMQCTTAYPTKPEQWGLNLIKDLQLRYKVPIGFSDHSGDIYACLAAAAMGANIFEFHVTFSKDMFGPDTKSSLTIEQVKQIVKGINTIQASLWNPVLKDKNESFFELKNIFEKSLSINKDLKKNDRLQFSDLESKKPKGYGIPASQFSSVIGKKLNKDLKKNSFLTNQDIDE